MKGIFSFLTFFLALGLIGGYFLVFSEQTLAQPQMQPPCAPGAFRGGICTAVDTPFGPIFTDPGQFIARVFLIILPISACIALLLIMRSGYKIMTAKGNPEGIQQGREQLVAAIVGLMFIIFSFVFIQLITRDLLKIPGFN